MTISWATFWRSDMFFIVASTQAVARRGFLSERTLWRVERFMPRTCPWHNVELISIATHNRTIYFIINTLVNYFCKNT